LYKISTEKKSEQDNIEEEKQGEQAFPPPPLTHKLKMEKGT
jgi:hypothetical protein